MDWHKANQQYLLHALADVRAALAAHAQVEDEAEPLLDAAVAPLPDPPPAIESLCRLFGLSPFERDIVLMCAGIELDARFAPLCAAALGRAQQDYPTFALALAALPDAHWSALSPDAPLRHWQLIDLDPHRSLTRSPLRLDERILHYLVGINYVDTRLAGRIEMITPDDAGLVPSHQRLAAQLAATWKETTGAPPIVQLTGAGSRSKQSVAAAACRQISLRLGSIAAAALPTAPDDLDQLRRLWEREAILSRLALLLDCDELDSQDNQRVQAINQFIATCQTPLLLASHQRWQAPRAALLTLELHQPAPAEQKAVWQQQLGPQAARLNGQIDQLVAHFSLDAPMIAAACHGVHGQLSAAAAPRDPASPAEIERALWQVCRIQARPQLDDLAQRIEATATWDDLVLPEQQRQVLQEIVMHVRHRTRVYDTWGFRGKGQRGLGISALFAGLSGTGKTMAAEVLAQALRLDLYRIDLSGVVSKYIGETEKNLRRVFDAAEGGGVVLLFDEADALFGQRSEVKDSHDRYANIEVSYLLQRMEAYRGLAILTTNLKESLDTAFLRRLRFMVDFPFPSVTERAAIWRGVFPEGTPRQAVDIDKLAQLNVTGGNIRNIALYAAFLAADADEPVGMAHLLQATRREYSKLKRTLTKSEIRAWVE